MPLPESWQTLNSRRASIAFAFSTFRFSDLFIILTIAKVKGFSRHLLFDMNSWRTEIKVHYQMVTSLSLVQFAFASIHQSLASEYILPATSKKKNPSATICYEASNPAPPKPLCPRSIFSNLISDHAICFLFGKEKTGKVGGGMVGRGGGKGVLIERCLSERFLKQQAACDACNVFIL